MLSPWLRPRSASPGARRRRTRSTWSSTKPRSPTVWWRSSCCSPTAPWPPRSTRPIPTLPCSGASLSCRLSVRWTLSPHAHLFFHQASPYASGEELYRPQKVGAFAGHGTVRAPLHEYPDHCCLLITVSPPSPPSDTSSSRALADSLDVAVVRRPLTTAPCVDALRVGPDGLTGYICLFFSRLRSQTARTPTSTSSSESSPLDACRRYPRLASPLPTPSLAIT